MNDKLIIKKITDKYWNIMDKHNNPNWAIEELEYLVYEVYKGEYFILNEKERKDVDNCFRILRKLKPTCRRIG